MADRTAQGVPYLGTKTMKPFDLIFTILASASVGLHKHGQVKMRMSIWEGERNQEETLHTAS